MLINDRMLRDKEAKFTGVAQCNNSKLGMTTLIKYSQEESKDERRNLASKEEAKLKVAVQKVN